MQSLRALKPKSNWFGFVTFIVQELHSLTVIGTIFCILYKESVKVPLLPISVTQWFTLSFHCPAHFRFDAPQAV